MSGYTLQSTLQGKRRIFAAIPHARILLSTLLLLCISTFSFAQLDGKFHKQIPDVPSKPMLVNDIGNMLTQEEELMLEQKLLGFNKETSNEVTIVTVQNLGGLEVQEFALELGRKWNIGAESKKNGVVILASKEDRKINISPARGLQGALPDIICGRIIRENIVPNFKAGNFYEGFSDGTDRIISATKGEFKNEQYGKGEEISGTVLLLIFLGFIGFIILITYINRKNRNIYASRRGYRVDSDTWFNLPSSGGGLFNSGGWGNSDNDSGGGFGGFGGGGGGFDGGGASGDW